MFVARGSLPRLAVLFPPAQEFEIESRLVGFAPRRKTREVHETFLRGARKIATSADLCESELWQQDSRVGTMGQFGFFDADRRLAAILVDCFFAGRPSFSLTVIGDRAGLTHESGLK